MRAPVSDLNLNAYVDGELGVEEAALLARRAAADPSIAARIAMLHQFKASVASLADGIEFRDPPPPARRAALPLRAWAVKGAIAAALALSLGTTWHFAAPGEDPAPQALAPANPMVSGHDDWSQAFDTIAGTPVAPEWLEGLMQATGLRLVHAVPTEIEGKAVMHYAFVGSNNCRLSLFEQPQPSDVDVALQVLFSNDLLTAHWQLHGFGYALVARNMDRTRFATIASAVHDVTRIRRPADEAIVASLSAARQRCTV